METAVVWFTETSRLMIHDETLFSCSGHGSQNFCSLQVGARASIQNESIYLSKPQTGFPTPGPYLLSCVSELTVH